MHDLPDVIGYYQVVMYKALGFTGSKSILISGIYNCVGPFASRCSGYVLKHHYLLIYYRSNIHRLLP